MSGIQLPDCSKLTINWKNDNGITIFRHDVIIKIFWRCFVPLMKFSYWSKFLVNIITGSGVMIIFFHKGLTRNPEIGNTPVWVLPNIWRLGQVGDTKFGMSVSNKMLLNPAKCHGYSFYCFWVIKGKPTGGEVKLPAPPKLGLKWSFNKITYYCVYWNYHTKTNMWLFLIYINQSLFWNLELSFKTDSCTTKIC